MSKSQSSLNSNSIEFYTALDKNMSSKEKNVPVKNCKVASAGKNKMVAVNPLNNKQVQKEPLFIPRKDRNSRSLFDSADDEKPGQTTNPYKAAF
jgi:hypothetical protein